jgi:lipopolysaccharide transport system ATP-binding protein
MGTITVSNLGKAYKQYHNRWSRLTEWMDPRGKPYHTLKWVLEGINFTVQAGEAVGIIGINGAGKSTLLKMITGTTQPTKGSVHISGRIAALLELGMGFHPDFTGRQNIYMAGQLLGYTVEEIRKLMPEIEAFAEIGDYIDQPVRVYSSGMQMRLAFSVATAHRPDVLIVDEALSVGDTYFQHKSFERIRQFRKQGTTLLIVSHDKASIQSICDRAILLDAGQLAMVGEPEAVMDFYNAMLASNQKQIIETIPEGGGKIRTSSGTGEAKVIEVTIIDSNNKFVELLEVGSTYRLNIIAETYADIEKLVLGYGFKDRLGQMVYGTNTFNTNRILKDIAAGTQISYTFEFEANIGPGTYSIVTALTSSDTHLTNNYDWTDRAMIFTVMNFNKPLFLGHLWLDHKTYITQKKPKFF